MSLSKIISYDNPANFDFPDTVEVTSRAALKNQINADELLYGGFATKDLLRSVGGSLVGTLGGGAVVGGGLLNIPGIGGSWGINPAGMLPGGLGGDSNICTIRFKVTPNYTGNPATNQYFYEEKLSSGGSRIWIYHSTLGSLNVEFRDSAGVGRGTLTGAWSPTAGTEYEFELNVNTSTGIQEYYIDGVLVATRSGFIFDRDNSTVNYLQVGFNSIVQNFALDDLQRFSTVQHTSNFASEVPRVVPLTTYVTTSPSIIESGPLQVDGLTSFTEVSTIPGGTDIKHILNVDGQDTYWDGAAWSNSDGSLAQSNYFSDINTNLPSLDVSAGVYLKLKSVLRSIGPATPELTLVNITYNFFAAVVSPVPCVIYGYVFDGVTPVVGATIDFKSREFSDESANFIHVNEQAVTDATGYFEISLPSTVRTGEDDIKVDVTIKFVDSKSKNARQNLTVVIPSSESSSLEDAKVSA